MSSTAGRLLRLCQKELRETLRDRRTIITLVLMPLLIYPVLSMTLNRFLLTSGQVGGQPMFIVGVASEREGRWLEEVLLDPRSGPPAAISAAADGQLSQFRFATPTGSGELGELLRTNEIDVIAEVDLDAPPPERERRGGRFGRGEFARVTLTAVNGNGNSELARRILAERLLYFEKALAAETLAAAEIRPPLSLEIEARGIGQAEHESMLVAIVPLVLVLMTITGAVYPAIDLTAGERERGTMESLVASPVARGAVLFAKYVAVVTVSLLTAIANLGAMLTTLWAGGLLPLLVGEGEPIPWFQFLQILGLLVLFSCFFSAVLLALTSFARSFKEAQAYLIPLMLLSLTPGVLSLMPGVELSGPLAVVPLLNIILLSREILAGSATAVTFLAAVLSTLAYAAAALAIAARLFGSDAVLRGSELSIGAAVRRPEQPRPRPSLSEAAMTLALLFPTYYLASNLLAQLAPAEIAPRLVVNALVLFAVFGGLPLLAALYCRDTLRTTYRLQAPPAAAVLGAAIMGLGLWTWAHELFLIAEMFGLQGLDASKISRVEAMVAEFRTIPAWLILACLAVTPAIVEELCFRGYLFSALAEKGSPAKAIGVTAVIFGLFHVLTGSTLLLERFLPTAMLGVVLGWIAWRTGSVWPGILLHLTHNGFLELAVRYRDELLAWGIGVEEQTHLPPLWFAAGSAAVLLGAALVAWSTRGRAEA
ncbi:ABC transporter permease subunit/CPBP intramembrane protease [Candidatus Laterigemmans baculatus]|uniref:ABC transporter permease subunit/CPBP intramembrane protease n=1 Tax=Candidatus Laterigemmans baculatus TaxID=2770505 RepID=UPI0013DCBF52|nr:ABC transporter permease subunit/CPBP intramembrane protease [Candidatus Laterigemmans baculatus]